MKEETPELVKAVCLPRGFVDKSEEDGLNNPSLELEMGELGLIQVWGRQHTGVILTWSQGYEETLNLLETEDIELFTEALDAAIAFVRKLTEYAERGKKQEQP